MKDLIDKIISTELNGDVIFRNGEKLIVLTDTTDFSNAIINLKAEKVEKIDEKYRRGSMFVYEDFKIIYSLGGY